MSQTSSDIGWLLIASESSLCTAESFTSGSLASDITSVSGASSYFRGSVVAYSEDIKTSVLSVDASVIAKYGVVSTEVAEAMAQGARKLMGADFALSTTGVAGPGGGTPEIPVGTVCMAIAGPGICESWSLHLEGSRGDVVNLSISAILIRFRDILAARVD
jgi:nicotinamide-nucleotide amidase